MYCVICNQSHSASHMRSKAHLSRKKQIYQDLTTLSKKEIEQIYLYQPRLMALVDYFELTLLDSHIWDGMRSPKMEKLFLKSKSRSHPETLSPPETEECRLSKVPGI